MMGSSDMGFAQRTRAAQVFSPLGPDVLLFHRMQGQERLGDLFTYELDLLSPNGAIAADQLLGEPLDIALTLPDGGVRYFNGIACRFAQLGAAEDGTLVQYQITLRPWLWLLTRTSNCRIFQKKAVPEIVTQVFRDRGFTDFEARLTRTYPQREYCVQYRESDFQFVSRLLEEEGIYYFFEHAQGKHTLILADSAVAHKTVPGYESIPYFEPNNSARRMRDHLFAWSFANEIQPGCCVLTDYDFTKPKANLNVRCQQLRSHKQAEWEVFDYPGRYAESEHGEHYARTRLEEFHAAYEQIKAEGNALGSTCGALFTLCDHPRRDQNREYLIVSAAYRLQNNAYQSSTAVSDDEFRCALTVLDSRQPYRPPRKTEKPFVRGPQTAVVVGPAGDEIYTDQYGRVKVQFHWDREGQRDENSSCWVRVSHPWAGKGWGMVAIPRIGQEVVVDFLEGDPDQPLITGRVYNADQMPPYALPANATQTGILTRSSKNGSAANCNEIRFEDKKGEEQLYIHAEKNQDIGVENDETHWVGHDRKKNIDHDETTVVGNDRMETVGNNETISIGVNRTETVGSNESITVGGNRTRHVGQNEIVTVLLTRTHNVGANEMINVGGAQEVTIGGLQAVTVGLTRVVSVGLSQDVNIGTSLSEDIGNNQNTSVGDNRSVTVGKDDSLSVGKNLVIDAGDSVVIKTGKATITMKRDGDIIISGKDIILKGSGEIKGQASKNVTIKGKKVLQN
jgi:type VI secretion system secreted protein VgrG